MKDFWAYVHWLLGITAGLVLCVIGITGALQSFEDDLLRWMNPHVFKATTSVPGGELSLQELFARTQAARPGKRIVSWQIFAESGYPVRAGFAAAAPQEKLQEEKNSSTPVQAAPAARARTEFRYLNPVSGELHDELKGAEFFRVVNDIHRRLAAGEAGKRIVGASVLALLVLCLSGLYLRWPHKPLNWRAWFKLDFKQKGRRFLRDLHMISGTWVLLLYLLSALTGLYWAYDWYQNGLYALTGTQRPAREVKLAAPAQASVDIEGIWALFLRESGGDFHNATLRFPEKREHALEVRYLPANPAHDRATNRLFLHPASGAVIAHERYADKATGAKLIASILPLHTGHFFGLPGTMLMMLSSLIMPLYAITGWKMYLDRRRRARNSAMAARKFAIVRGKNQNTYGEINAG